MNRIGSNASSVPRGASTAEEQKVQQQPQLAQADSTFKCISALDKDEEV